jgi:hypothetical protein
VWLLWCKNVERSEDLKYYEMKLDELDLLLLDEDAKKSYMTLRNQEPAMLPVDADGTVHGFKLHDALDICFRKYPDTSQASQSIAVDPVEKHRNVDSFSVEW